MLGGHYIRETAFKPELMKKHRISSQDREETVRKTIKTACKEKGILINALQNGSRMRNISHVRKTLAMKLVNEYGLTLAETARQLGVSTTAVAKIVYKEKKLKK